MTQAQNTVVGFEIGDLDALPKQVTHRVAVVTNADGDEICGFEIVGKNSPEYQKASNDVRIDNIKRAAKRSKTLDTSTDEGAAAISATVDRNETTIALAVVVNWFGFNLEGAPMTFDKSVVEKLFRTYPQWRSMVSTALDNDGNFMKV